MKAAALLAVFRGLEVFACSSLFSGGRGGGEEGEEVEVRMSWREKKAGKSLAKRRTEGLRREEEDVRIM